ncbi:MAG TPA: phosphomethylpyrimidine synthase ThiC [Candidatus Latescibacteria bacterium]|nr:phosphomethylpyrimidine synthase ThiC [Candidatus Latescibacterota bacterium]
MTQMSEAKAGRITPDMELVAEDEDMEPEIISQGIAKGEIVIVHNVRHRLSRIIAIGKGLRTKVNANIGTSTDFIDTDTELKKLVAALEAGTDTVMDLSTGGDLNSIRKQVLRASSVPVGTVPIYQAAVEAIAETGTLTGMTKEKIFDVIELQARDGVDFMTVHCGVTRNTLERLKQEGRITDIVSRGGVFLTTWMVANDKENPLYEDYDRLLEIARRYDVVLSLGDGLRPGCVADATDRAQVQELILLGELTKRAWERDVQVIIEGPGHLPLDQIQANVLLEKRLCHNAPFYVLGPIVTDIAPGYDHITSAIGAAYAASAGADFLCYVTPGEHLRLPTTSDVREGVIATRIAAHIGDMTKGLKGTVDWDLKMAKARKKLDWNEQMKLAIDPEIVRKTREESKPRMPDVCTMCGEYCALKMVKEALGGEVRCC